MPQRPAAGRPAGRPGRPRVAGTRRPRQSYRAPVARDAGTDAADTETDGIAAEPTPARPEAAERPGPGPSPRPRAGTEQPADPGGRPAIRTGAAGRLWAVAAGLFAVAVVLAVLTLGWLGSYRHAQARADAWQQALPAAKEKVARLFSYDYRHIQDDRNQVGELLTGQFRTDYQASMDKLVLPQAPAKKFVLVSTTQSAGVSSVTPDGSQAVVIVFLNQSVTNADVASRTDLVRLRVTMTRVNGAWLIADVKSV